MHVSHLNFHTRSYAIIIFVSLTFPVEVDIVTVTVSPFSPLAPYTSTG